MSAFFLLANAGAPLLVYLIAMPLLWLLLIPIVIVEMLWAKKIMGVSTSRALTISIVANAVSTAIGVPLAWFAMVPNAGSTASAALTAAFFFIPAFFISFLVEWVVALPLVPAGQRNTTRRWSWRANLSTYEGMLVILLAVALLDRLR